MKVEKKMKNKRKKVLIMKKLFLLKDLVNLRQMMSAAQSIIPIILLCKRSLHRRDRKLGQFKVQGGALEAVFVQYLHSASDQGMEVHGDRIDEAGWHVDLSIWKRSTRNLANLSAIFFVKSVKFMLGL